MAGIISSSYQIDPQGGNIHRVTERHIDILGVTHTKTYTLTGTTEEVTALVEQRIVDSAAELEIQLGDEEFSTNLQGILVDDYTLSSSFLILSAHHQRLAEYYLGTTTEETCRIGQYLSTLSDAELGTLFNLSGAALVGMLTRLASNVSLWVQYQGATGTRTVLGG
jgi:hypothetical protein